MKLKHKHIFSLRIKFIQLTKFATVNVCIKVLASQDSQIESSNKRLCAAADLVAEADGRELSAEYTSAGNPGNERRRVDLLKAAKRKESAINMYKKVLEDSASKIGMGSGRVGLLLLPQAAWRLAQSS